MRTQDPRFTAHRFDRVDEDTTDYLEFEVIAYNGSRNRTATIHELRTAQRI